jgi:hypothetical protein
MSLGVQFVVVVRDLVRHKDPQRGPAWRRKWANVQQCTGNSADKLRHWITCATQPSEPGQVFHTLLGDDSVSLGLTFRPGDGSHVFDLAEALDAGMPIAIWPHRCEHSQAPAQPASPYTGPEFQGKLTERLASRGLAELPRIVFELRKEAGGHPGTGMTLLWDDPTRRPEPDYSLEAPALFQP